MTSDSARKIGKTILNVLLCCGAVAIIIENITLVRENRSLHRAVDKITAQIQAGQELGNNLVASSADGRLTTIPLPASDADHLLIITFSPGCPGCRANQERWAKLAHGLEQRGWRVVWVSRDPIDTSVEYSREHQIPLSDVFVDPPYRTYLRLGLSRVPNTLVVAPGGVIQKVWPGMLENAQWNEIFAYFNLDEAGSSSAALVH